MYDEKHFRKGTTEEEAVKMMREFAKKNRVRCCINYPSLKSIWVEYDREDTVSYYPPKLKFTNWWLIPLEDGQGIGRPYP